MNRLAFSDRFWLAWRVLRGSLVSYRADAETTRVVMEFTARERKTLARGLDRADARARRRNARR